VQTGLEIMKALRGWTSGLANPHFVIDAPGGGGKIPLLPEYVESITEHEVVLKNFKGDRYVYRQPKGIPPHRGGVHDPEYLIQPAFNDRG
jgi:lysine 2,3-aminomutase